MPAWSVPGIQSTRSPAHAVPANENVALGVLEHVPHVQIACHIGRGQQNRKGGLAVQAILWSRRRLGEELLAHPVLRPVIFNGGRVVCFRQVVRHGGRQRAPGILRRNPDFTRISDRGTTLHSSRFSARARRRDRRLQAAKTKAASGMDAAFVSLKMLLPRTDSACPGPSSFSSCLRIPHPDWPSASSSRRLRRSAAVPYRA